MITGVCALLYEKHFYKGSTFFFLIAFIAFMFRNRICQKFIAKFIPPFSVLMRILNYYSTHIHFKILLLCHPLMFIID